MASAHPGGSADVPRGGIADLRRSEVVVSAGSLPVLRDELTEWARVAGLHEEATESLALAGYEAMANAVEHAYGGMAGPLDVEAVRHVDRVQVTIADHGTWLPEHDGDQHRQRGLPLIRGLADEAVVHSDQNGTTVSMSWLISAGIERVTN